MSRLLLTLLLCSFWLDPSIAQSDVDSSADGITATGVSEFKTRPEWLEMTIEIEGRSSEFPAAVAELKRRVAVARKRLEELDAINGSVIAKKPQIQGSASPEQLQQMDMMMEQYGGGERGKKMLEQTKSVSISQTVVARWPLSDGDDFTRLLEANQLTEKIKNADIGSASESQPVSAAQEELASEMAAMMAQYSWGEQKTKSGEPVFRFIATMESPDHQKALTEAFAVAKREIQTLANATGTTISSPVPSRSRVDLVPSDDYYSQGNVPPPSMDTKSGNFELKVTNPIEATFIVEVHAIAKHTR